MGQEGVGLLGSAWMTPRWASYNWPSLPTSPLNLPLLAHIYIKGKKERKKRKKKERKKKKQNSDPS